MPQQPEREDGAEPGAAPDGVPRAWEIEFFEDDDGRKPVLEWIKNDLSPTKRRALGTAMRRILQVQGPQVCRSHWGTALGDDLFEFRLRMNGKGVINLEAEVHGITEDEARERFGLDPSMDILLRVFCTARKGKIVVLLNSYDKGEDASSKRQTSEIKAARKRLGVLERRDAVARKEARRAGKKT